MPDFGNIAGLGLPRIQFPDVPLAKGVPNLVRAAGGAAQQVGAIGKIMGISGGIMGTFLGQYINAALAPQYALLDDRDNKVIRPDGFGEMEFKGEANIATAPTEAGGFQSYNKVVTPEEIPIVMICSGQGVMSREDFLKKCQEIKSSAKVMKLVTPDHVFPAVCCTSMSYRRTAREGATLLQVRMTFKEVRESGKTSYPATKSDSSKKTKEGGRVTVTPIGDKYLKDVMIRGTPR